MPDPNMERLVELKAKQASRQEFTEEEEAFLERMAADPNYPVEGLNEDQD